MNMSYRVTSAELNRIDDYSFVFAVVDPLPEHLTDGREIVLEVWKPDDREHPVVWAKGVCAKKRSDTEFVFRPDSGYMAVLFGGMMSSFMDVIDGLSIIDPVTKEVL